MQQVVLGKSPAVLEHLVLVEIHDGQGLLHAPPLQGVLALLSCEAEGKFE